MFLHRGSTGGYEPEHFGWRLYQPAKKNIYGSNDFWSPQGGTPPQHHPPCFPLALTHSKVIPPPLNLSPLFPNCSYFSFDWVIVPICCNAPRQTNCLLEFRHKFIEMFIMLVCYFQFSFLKRCYIML